MKKTGKDLKSSKQPGLLAFAAFALFMVQVGAISTLKAHAQSTGTAPTTTTPATTTASTTTATTKKSKKAKADTTTAPAATTPATTPAKTSSVAPAPASAPNKTSTPAPSTGQVWVNTDTGVYHTSSSRYYGKTKTGKYMSEADAIKTGFHKDKSEK